MEVFLAITAIGFVILAISAITGHHEFGGIEHDHDFSHDHDAHGDSDGSPSFLSTRILSLFAVAFEAIGAISTHKGAPALLSIILALAGGGGLAYLGLLLMRLFWRQQASSTVGSDEFLAQYAEVHTAIPANGYGEVSVVVREQRFYLPARSKGGVEIPRGTRVLIYQHEGTKVVVESMETHLISE